MPSRMLRRTLRRTLRGGRVGLVFWALLAACGGGDLPPPLPDPGPDSGLDPRRLVVDLAADEVGLFCDWTAGRFGGYGRRRTCMDGTYVSAQRSRAACISDWMNAAATCPLTVGNFQECVNGVVDPPACVRVPPVCLSIVFCAPQASPAE